MSRSLLAVIAAFLAITSFSLWFIAADYAPAPDVGSAPVGSYHADSDNQTALDTLNRIAADIREPTIVEEITVFCNQAAPNWSGVISFVVQKSMADQMAELAQRVCYE